MSLHPSIRTIRDDSGLTRYVVPRKMEPALKVFGAFLCLLGGFFLALSGSTMLVPLFSAIDQIPKADVVGVLFLTAWAVFSTVFAVIPALLFVVGLWLIFGTAEVEITGDELRVTSRLWGLGLTRRRRLATVATLVHSKLIVRQRSGRGGAFTGDYTLVAECLGQEPCSIAYAAEDDVAWSLGEHLARAISARLGRTVPLERRERPPEGSRGWSGEAKSGPTGQLPAGCAVVFFLPFAAVGGFFFYMMLTQLLAGDPGNNLQGPFPWKWLWLLFPLPFIGVGVGGLVYAVRTFLRARWSPEAVAAGDFKSDARAPLPDVARKPGPYRAESSASPGCALAALTVVLPLLVLTEVAAVNYRILPLFDGRPVYDIFLFAAIALPVVIFAAGWFWLRAWSHWTSARPAVELTTHPVRQGQTARAKVSYCGPAMLDAVVVTLYCTESVRYMEGTVTRDDSVAVQQQELLRRTAVCVSRGEPWVAEVTFVIDGGSMHSFESENNRVTWTIKVESTVAGVERPEESFAFAVLPVGVTP